VLVSNSNRTSIIEGEVGLRLRNKLVGGFIGGLGHV
jgi:hypothetical protein